MRPGTADSPFGQGIIDKIRVRSLACEPPAPKLSEARDALLFGGTLYDSVESALFESYGNNEDPTLEVFYLPAPLLAEMRYGPDVYTDEVQAGIHVMTYDLTRGEDIKDAAALCYALASDLARGDAVISGEMSKLERHARQVLGIEPMQGRTPMPRSPRLEDIHQTLSHKGPEDGGSGPGGHGAR